MTPGGTVFLSSHELEEVQRVVDRVAIIKDGRIVVTDTIDGLRRRRHPAPSSSDSTIRVDHGRGSKNIDGVRVTSNDGRSVTLTYTGELAPVLRAAADLGAVDVSSRPTDLDDLFLRYYRGEDQS